NCSSRSFGNGHGDYRHKAFQTLMATPFQYTTFGPEYKPYYHRHPGICPTYLKQLQHGTF
ncbi:MAG: hypothetical protein ACKOKF_06710, partial [Bacteroidota bacterium]